MNPKFYFLVVLTAVLAAVANALTPVNDVDGNFISYGSYYVLPTLFGGGLTLAPLGDNQCPLYVGQARSEVDRGIPVKFSNWRPSVSFVPESAQLNIHMDVAATTCVQSPYWWVDVSDRKGLIVAGPEPFDGFYKSFFQIKRSGDVPNGYKITFCPYDNCFDVGIFVDENGVRRLALSSTPFPVVFVKVTGTETSSKTMSII